MRLRGAYRSYFSCHAHLVPGIFYNFFGQVSAYMLDVLHLLPFHHQLLYHLTVLVWRCLLGLAPGYVRGLCYHTLGNRGRSFLRSMEQGVLFVPFARTSTCLARAILVVGPSVWNGLPLALRLLPRVHSDEFYSCLKTVLFSHARVESASE